MKHRVDIFPIHRPLFLLLGGAALLCAFFSPLKVIGGLTALAFAILTFRDPRHTMYFLCVLIPLEPFLLKFVPDDIYVYTRFFSEVLVYLVVLSTALLAVRGRARVRPAPALIAILLIVVSALISSVINGVEPSAAVLGIRQIIRFMLLAAAVAILPHDRVFVRRIVCILIAVALFESALGIGQALVGGPADSFLIPSERKVFGDVQLTAGTTQFWESGQRVFATMGRYDQLGTFLCLVLLLAVGMLYVQNPKLQTVLNFGFRNYLGFSFWNLVLLFLLGIPALILTYSRASWFGFLLGLFCLGWLVKRDKRILIAFALAIAAFAAYLLVSWGVVSQLIDTPRQSVMQRLSESMSPERWRGEYYGLGRLFYIVHTPLDVIPLSPLWGVGPGRYGGGAAAALHSTDVYDRAHIPFGIYGTEGYIDNNWFALWGELGTVGLALYLFLFVMLFCAALSVYRSPPDEETKAVALAFVGIAAAVSFQAFLGTYLEVRTLAFYFWLLAGIVVSASQTSYLSASRRTLT